MRREPVRGSARPQCACVARRLTTSAGALSACSRHLYVRAAAEAAEVGEAAWCARARARAESVSGFVVSCLSALRSFLRAQARAKRCFVSM